MIRAIFSLAIAIVFISCSEKETPGGLKFTILKRGDGKEIQSGEFMVIEMILRNPKDSILVNTYENGMPAIVPVPDESIAKDPGEFGVFKMLTKGDCVTFKLSAKRVFATRRRPVPKAIDPNSLFGYTIQLKDIWTKSQADAFQAEQVNKMQSKQRAIDSVLITEHLKAKGIETLNTPSGLRYVITKKGNGQNASPGKTAFVHYAGYFLDGRMFDTSSATVAKANNFNNGGNNNPYPVVVNARGVIPGWDEILQLMNKGMRITVFIPSHLGYGPEGRRGIPPNTVLKFDMEIIDLK